MGRKSTGFATGARRVILGFGVGYVARAFEGPSGPHFLQKRRVNKSYRVNFTGITNKI